MMFRRMFASWICFSHFFYCSAQPYPRNYFRSPLNIPMQLVANFGEIRPNHWHMGLDIRTQRKVNLPVYAAADGYIARVSIEPSGFGQAIYINHPNGFTTVYGHLNSFTSEVESYVKGKQYAQQSWKINLVIPPQLFPVKKGQLIALSGSTGGSEGPHVHFEIRDTRTDKNVNPLLFNFPVADNVPPSILRLAMYDRNKSTYEQTPRLFGLKKYGSSYILATTEIIHAGSDKISFAIGAVDNFSHSKNPNGIYSARIMMDGTPESEFVLDRISYDDTRYINAQIDYRYKYNGGNYLQHISPLPGDHSTVYNIFQSNGILQLNDPKIHKIIIEVMDANNNVSRLRFNVQYDSSISLPYSLPGEKMIPNNVNIAERNGFELFTTDASLYDSVTTSYTSAENNAGNSISPLHNFLSPAIPVHDEVTVRIKPTIEINDERNTRIIIKNTAGNKIFVERATWQKGWLSAKFRQFGSYQAFIDNEPPTINPPGYGEIIDLTRSGRIVFTPKDNFNSIRSFRAELDGRWLCFSNDKGLSWIYKFDSHFPGGEHELKVMVEDEAGNITTKVWKVKR